MAYKIGLTDQALMTAPVLFCMERASSTHIGLANHTCTSFISGSFKKIVTFVLGFFFFFFSSNPFTNLPTPFHSPLPSLANLLPSFVVLGLQCHHGNSSNSRRPTIMSRLVAQNSIVLTPSPPTITTCQELHHISSIANSSPSR